METLYDDVLKIIFGFLTEVEHVALRLTCQRFNGISLALITSRKYAETLAIRGVGKKTAAALIRRKCFLTIWHFIEYTSMNVPVHAAEDSPTGAAHSPSYRHATFGNVLHDIIIQTIKSMFRATRPLVPKELLGDKYVPACDDHIRDMPEYKLWKWIMRRWYNIVLRSLENIFTYAYGSQSQLLIEPLEHKFMRNGGWCDGNVGERYKIYGWVIRGDMNYFHTAAVQNPLYVFGVPHMERIKYLTLAAKSGSVDAFKEAVSVYMLQCVNSISAVEFIEYIVKRRLLVTFLQCSATSYDVIHMTNLSGIFDTILMFVQMTCSGKQLAELEAAIRYHQPVRITYSC
jgi:hypothetical protein